MCFVAVDDTPQSTGSLQSLCTQNNSIKYGGLLTTAHIVRHHLFDGFPVASQTFRQQIRIDWIRYVFADVSGCFIMLSLIFTDSPNKSPRRPIQMQLQLNTIANNIDTVVEDVLNGECDRR